MEEFARWTRDDRLHPDPWIRTHQRLGATVLAPAPRSMVVPGTVTEWEKWTLLTFPQTERYVVPDDSISWKSTAGPWSKLATTTANQATESSGRECCGE
jgi:hypothetical protein